jgi:hypothetical protein
MIKTPYTLTQFVNESEASADFLAEERPDMLAQFSMLNGEAGAELRGFNRRAPR